MMPSVNEMPATNGHHEDWRPLLELAAREVFQMMLGCQLTVPATVEEGPLETTTMVGLAGKLRGVMSLRCDWKSAALMTSKMLGVEPNEAGVEMSDSLGEVCNMIAGNFKNKIAGMGSGCMLSLPTVITGTDYSLHSRADSPGLEVKLLFEGLPIVVSLQIRG